MAGGVAGRNVPQAGAVEGCTKSILSRGGFETHPVSCLGFGDLNVFEMLILDPFRGYATVNLVVPCKKSAVMPRTTKTITISVPPEMADQIEEIMREEGRTKSELLREALRQYMQDRQWKKVLRRSERRAKDLGITPDDVERLVDEYRSESP
jgi:CopG family transcriptional regulator / antitoxin EndoAI